MYWWADMWNSVAQFFGYDEWVWGSVGEWAAAIGTTLAVGATIGLYRHGRLIDARKQADAFHTSLSVHTLGNESGSIQELKFRATNSSEATIWFATLYVPGSTEEAAYTGIRLYSNELVGSLDGGQSVTRYLPVTDVQAVRQRIIVRFRDARNRWWYREVEGARYISEGSWKKIEGRHGVEMLANSQAKKAFIAP